MTSINQFTCINIRELPAWMLTFRSLGITDPETILKELTLIDDLLTISKSYVLLNRKRGLKVMLEARIGKELGHKTPNLNTRPK
jgi:hypothetical protein